MTAFGLLTVGVKKIARIFVFKYLDDVGLQHLGNKVVTAKIFKPKSLHSIRAEAEILPRFRGPLNPGTASGDGAGPLQIVKDPKLLIDFPGSGTSKARTLFDGGSRLCDEVCGKQISTTHATSQNGMSSSGLAAMVTCPGFASDCSRAQTNRIALVT